VIRGAGPVHGKATKTPPLTPSPPFIASVTKTVMPLIMPPASGVAINNKQPLLFSVVEGGKEGVLDWPALAALKFFRSTP